MSQIMKCSQLARQFRKLFTAGRNTSSVIQHYYHRHDSGVYLQNVRFLQTTTNFYAKKKKTFFRMGSDAIYDELKKREKECSDREKQMPVFVDNPEERVRNQIAHDERIQGIIRKFKEDTLKRRLEIFGKKKLTYLQLDMEKDLNSLLGSIPSLPITQDASALVQKDLNTFLRTIPNLPIIQDLNTFLRTIIPNLRIIQDAHRPPLMLTDRAWCDIEEDKRKAYEEKMKQEKNAMEEEASRLIALKLQEEIMTMEALEQAKRAMKEMVEEKEADDVKKLQLEALCKFLPEERDIFSTRPPPQTVNSATMPTSRIRGMNNDDPNCQLNKFSDPRSRHGSNETDVSMTSYETIDKMIQSYRADFVKAQRIDKNFVNYNNGPILEIPNFYVPPPTVNPTDFFPIRDYKPLPKNDFKDPSDNKFHEHAETLQVTLANLNYDVEPIINFNKINNYASFFQDCNSVNLNDPQNAYAKHFLNTYENLTTPRPGRGIGGCSEMTSSLIVSYAKQIVERNQLNKNYPVVSYVTPGYAFKLYEQYVKPFDGEEQDLDALAHMLLVDSFLSCCGNRVCLLPVEILFFPYLHGGSYALLVADYKLRRIVHMDPKNYEEEKAIILKKGNVYDADLNAKPIHFYISVLQSVLSACHQKQHAQFFDWSNWSYADVKNIQKAKPFAADTGAYICNYMEYYSRRAGYNFQLDALDIRHRIFQGLAFGVDDVVDMFVRKNY